MEQMKKLVIQGKEFEVVDAVARSNYVTPEMFGAKGDGVTDDASAIQQAIDSGITVLLNNKEYAINSTLQISANCSGFINRGMISYQGYDYAINIDGCRNIKFDFGRIYAPNGGGIKLTDTITYSMYLEIEFSTIACLTDCILLDSRNTFINELRFKRGMFSSGANGLRVVSTKETSTIIFDEVGIEGVTTGFKLENTENRIINFVINNCRFMENFTTLIDDNSATNTVPNIIFITGTGLLLIQDKLNVNKSTIYTSGYMATSSGSIVGNNVTLYGLHGHYVEAGNNKQRRSTIVSKDANGLVDLRNRSNIPVNLNYIILSNSTAKVILPDVFKNQFNFRNGSIEINLMVYLESNDNIKIYKSDGTTLIGDYTASTAGIHITKVYYVTNFGAYVVEDFRKINKRTQTDA